MKSFVAIVLTSLILGSSFLPGFGIDQSARWGELVQHYQQHQQTDAGLSFVDFLAMHYGANSEHQKHPNHSHHNLPSGGHSVPVYSPNAVRLFSPSPVQVIFVATADFFCPADLYNFLAVYALINPPRA